jgi:hypothetical protein
MPSKKEIDMFNLAKAKKAIHEASSTEPANAAITWTTPVHFDATLVARLVDQHRQLSEHLMALVAKIDGSEEMADDPPIMACAVRDCASQLHNLRRTEALWLYPVIAREFAADPVARRLFWQARLSTLGLARCLLRRVEDLATAIEQGTDSHAAADHVTPALADYCRRNEAEMYPLYNLMELCDMPGSQAA